MYALIEASGVFSSCETLATKSCRIRSSRRSSVTSWKTSTAPGGGEPGRGVPWTASTRGWTAERDLAAGQRDLALVGLGRPASVASTASWTCGLRISSGTSRPTGRASRPKSWSALALAKRSRRRASIAITPSAIPLSTARSCWRSCSRRSIRASSRGATASSRRATRPTRPPSRAWTGQQGAPLAQGRDAPLDRVEHPRPSPPGDRRDDRRDGQGQSRRDLDHQPILGRAQGSR